MRIADIIAAIAIATVIAVPMVMAQSVNSGSGAGVEVRPYCIQGTGPANRSVADVPAGVETAPTPAAALLAVITTVPVGPIAASDCG
jgi:hypothetical protein